jgi:hypothetical protein
MGGLGRAPALCGMKMKRFWIRLMAELPLGDTTVLIDQGKVEVKRGKVSSRLLSELDELSKSMNIDVGCIHAQTTPVEFRLSFIGIPKELRQRFRNVWGANR